MLPFIPLFRLKYFVTFCPDGATGISVGQRPTYGFPLENKALKGRKPKKPNDDNHFQNQNNTIAAALTGLWCFIFVT
jgi:hypothetical protein